MNKTTKYTELLLNFIENSSDYSGLLEWVDELPDIDQPDVYREMVVLFRKRYEKTGEKNILKIASIIEKGVDQFEEDILDKKLDKALFMMQFDGLEINPDHVLPFLIEARKVVIKCILSNPVDIKEMRKLAQKLIKMEKRSGDYNPVNWSEIYP